MTDFFPVVITEQLKSSAIIAEKWDWSLKEIWEELHQFYCTMFVVLSKFYYYMHDINSLQSRRVVIPVYFVNSRSNEGTTNLVCLPVCFQNYKSTIISNLIHLQTVLTDMNKILEPEIFFLFL